MYMTSGTMGTMGSPGQATANPMNMKVRIREAKNRTDQISFKQTYFYPSFATFDVHFFYLNIENCIFGYTLYMTVKNKVVYNKFSNFQKIAIIMFKNETELEGGGGCVGMLLLLIILPRSFLLLQKQRMTCSQQSFSSAYSRRVIKL